MARWDHAWHQRLRRILAELPSRTALEQREIRRTLAADPIAFALIYLRHHLRGKETGDRITFSEVHYEWARRAMSWREPMTEPMESRDAEVAPRSMGKTTWWFLIIPLWAGANEIVSFLAAFANTTGQAEGHLTTFKAELESNILLRADFPELCEPARQRTGGTVADRQGMLMTKGGFIFAAKGVDSSSLGMKRNEKRPDVLILDDIEPDEASYSPALVTKRLGTVLDAILPLNIYARVVFIGTVTMPGSIMHQLVKSANGVDVGEDGAWIAEERIRAHHHRAIVLGDDGVERSVWEAKWPLHWLQGRRHTREYAKNYDNDPMARDGIYWTRDDIEYGAPHGFTRTALFVDPAVTARKTSDYTGLAVVSWTPGRSKDDPGRAVVRWATGVRLIGQPLRDKISQVLGAFPEIKLIRVETNQGGDLWTEALGRYPRVVVQHHHTSDSKEVRFARALLHWQQGRVLHEERIPLLEEQMVGFPNMPHDDVVDAAVAGVEYFLGKSKRPRPGKRTRSYVRST